MNEKIYCYVDETGHDTAGKLFIVGLVFSSKEKDLLEKSLMSIEK